MVKLASSEHFTLLKTFLYIRRSGCFQKKSKSVLIWWYMPSFGSLDVIGMRSLTMSNNTKLHDWEQCQALHFYGFIVD